MFKKLKKTNISFLITILILSLTEPINVMAQSEIVSGSISNFINRLFKKDKKTIYKELEDYGYSCLPEIELIELVDSYSWQTNSDYEYVEIISFNKNDAIKVSDFVKLSEEERYKLATDELKTPTITLLIYDNLTGQDSYLDIPVILSNDSIDKINNGEYLDHKLIEKYLVETINNERTKNNITSLTTNVALVDGIHQRAVELAQNGSIAFKNDQGEQMYMVRDSSGTPSLDVFSGVEAKNRASLFELNIMSYPSFHVDSPYQYLCEKYIAEIVAEDIKEADVLYSPEYSYLNYDLAVNYNYNLYLDDPEEADSSRKLSDQPISHVFVLSNTVENDVLHLDIHNREEVGQYINEQIKTVENTKVIENNVIISESDVETPLEETYVNVVFESNEGLLNISESQTDSLKLLDNLYASSSVWINYYQLDTGEITSNAGYQLNNETYVNSFNFVLRHTKDQQLELNAFAEAVKKAVDGLSDMEKARYIYDLVIDMSDYDEGVLIEYRYSNNYSLSDVHEDNTLDGNITSTSVHSPYSILESGKGVCQAYAGLFQLLAEHCGLESRYVPGYAHEDGTNYINYEDYGHAWNDVKIDGVWYSVDPTWGDIMNKESAYFTDEESAMIRDLYFMTDLSSTHVKLEDIEN